jgi:hypothetical protein
MNPELILPEQHLINHITQAVNDEEVDFLDACGARIRYSDFDIIGIEFPTDGATVAPGEGDDPHLTGMRCRNGRHDIRGIAGRGNCQQTVCRIAERGNLF